MLKMKVYEYMVNYCYPTGKGRMRISTHDKIESYEDVETVDKVVRDESAKPKAFVTDFKLLREYEVDKKCQKD